MIQLRWASSSRCHCTGSFAGVSLTTHMMCLAATGGVVDRTLRGDTMIRRAWFLGALICVAATPHGYARSADNILSHPPLRPLPEIAKRPLAKGPSLFVDPARGKDDADGSDKAPWRTI